MPRRRELAVAFGLLALLGAAVFGVHIAQGGFAWDDWQIAARVRFPPVSDDFIGWVDLKVFAFRPLSAIILGLPAAVFGDVPAWHLAFGLLVSVGTAVALYAYLRVVVPLAPVHAGAIAALTLIFPWSDSMVLWPTAALNWLGPAFYFLGTIAALRGLQAEGRRSRRLAAGALALFLLSLWSYEIAGPAIVAGLLLYLRVAPRERALRRWAVDAGVTVAWLVVVGLNTQRATQDLGGLVAHAGSIADHALTVAARALVPVAGVPRLAVLAVVAALVAAGHLRARRAADPDAAAALRRWAWLVPAALAAIAVSYVLVIPAADRYGPLRPGIENRINLLAAPAYVTFAYASVLLAFTLAATARPAWRRGAAAAAAVAVAAIGAGYVVRVAHDIGSWDDAAAARERILDGLQAAVPDPVPGTTLYAYGASSYQAPGVPIFAVTWDGRSAVRLRYDDRSLGAFTVRPGRRFVCYPGGVKLNDPSYRRTQGSLYGQSVLVDVRTRQAIPITDVPSCEAANRFLAAAPAPPPLARDATARHPSAQVRRRPPAPARPYRPPAPVG